MTTSSGSPAQKEPSLFGLLRPYSVQIGLLIVLALLSNGLNLVLPQIIARGIDAYTGGTFNMETSIAEFFGASLLIFIFTYMQNIVQTYASEQVARDMRTRLSAKISRQSYAFIDRVTPSKLLTNLTSDIDAVKTFVSQAIVSILSSIFIIGGASILLLLINWQLALAVLVIIPIIGGAFFIIFRQVRTLFKKSQEVIDWLNRVINESILGSSLIRVLNSQQTEYDKFIAANTGAKDLGMQILRLFAALIPVITFVASMATLIILALGGHFVIAGTMTLGDFAAFNSYLSILIFPILIIGFMSNVIARATASYKRITDVLEEPEPAESGTLEKELRGDIRAENVTLTFGEKTVLKNVSFTVDAGTKTAIIGPTDAGKTQLLYLLTGLARPDSGTILYDNHPIDSYNQTSLHQQIGFVFQDSIIFNMTLRENISFSTVVDDASLELAIATAELHDFIDALPQKLDTIVSERGASLSGGQKQRIMLARALALNPKVLLLDDFTARVDTKTEQKILENVRVNYPNLTLVSVTQKIASAEQFDTIILLMEGEMLATGTHAELMETSPEYVQIAESQRSTNTYELHAH